MKKIILVLLLILTTHTFTAQETPKKTAKPDSHAPIGVMADHIHGRGEFMLSYRYMHMYMKELQSEGDAIDNATAFQQYMIAAQQMTMGMHMLGAMYAPTNKLTLMLMGNYITNDMDLEAKNGKQFSTQSGAFGDISLSALYGVFKNENNSIHLQVGLSIPTGAIEQKDVTPLSMGNEIQLPYPMQTGTGSFGTILGATYLWKGKALSGGAQLKGTLFLGDNDQDYKFGNRYGLTTWVAKNLADYVSVSLRGEAKIVDKIDGQSPLLNPIMVNTADTDSSGGTYINGGLGLNFILPHNIRLATEMVLPISQKLNGIQLEQRYMITLGLQYAFK